MKKLNLLLMLLSAGCQDNPPAFDGRLDVNPYSQDGSTYSLEATFTIPAGMFTSPPPQMDLLLSLSGDTRWEQDGPASDSYTGSLSVEFQPGASLLVNNTTEIFAFTTLPSMTAEGYNLSQSTSIPTLYDPSSFDVSAKNTITANLPVKFKASCPHPISGAVATKYGQASFSIALAFGEKTYSIGSYVLNSSTVGRKRLPTDATDWTCWYYDSLSDY